MKRRDFLNSSALGALASNLNLPGGALQGLGEVNYHGVDRAGRMTSEKPLGITPTAEEMLQASQWFAAKFSDRAATRPFSFSYDGKASGGLLATWPSKIQNKNLDGRRVQRTIVWTDLNTKLEVRCVAVQYLDFPVVEWTVYFKNTGRENTPILENIQALDIHLENRQGEFELHHNRGDFASPESYQPYSDKLLQNTTTTFAPAGGRPTNVAFPYYNLQMPGGGLIVAIGWPGQWATTFRRDDGPGLNLSAGQELTHLYLEPDEEIRTPLMALLFWQTADNTRAQNLWRRWMLAHTLPRPGGKLPSPILTFGDGDSFAGLEVDAASEKRSVNVLTREGIKLDYWWLDAGWYPCGFDWWNTGTWEPDPVRFPKGLRDISDYVHARGMKLVVWFEPERVTAGSWLEQHHPDWLLNDVGHEPADNSNDNYYSPADFDGEFLLNLGRTDVRAWLVGHIGGLIAEQRIDLYRQDFNIDPLPFWRKNDPIDRQGITENLYVQGYLAYWDALRRRFPNLLIDSCASGGRRNDLETMRRAVPLDRSDYPQVDGVLASTAGTQCQTYGLSSWIPYNGKGTGMPHDNAAYCVRSYMSPAFGVGVNVREEQVDWNLYRRSVSGWRDVYEPKVDWDLYRRLVSDWRDVADCMLGDYYPLTEYTSQKDQWIAWQFDLPENNKGMIQAFRREHSEQTSMNFRLQGIDAGAQYRIKNLDEEASSVVSGEELLEHGLVVELSVKPGAAIFTYEKLS